MNVNHSFWKLTERSNYAKAERHILTILVFLSSVFSFCSRLALQDVQSCISSGLIFKRHRNKVLCSWLDEADDLERACVTLWRSGGQSSWKFDIQKRWKKRGLTEVKATSVLSYALWCHLCRWTLSLLLSLSVWQSSAPYLTTTHMWQTYNVGHHKITAWTSSHVAW